MSADKHPSVNLTQFAACSGLLASSPELLEQKEPPNNDGFQTIVKPKRRRRLPTNENQPTKGRMFYFVDSNSSSREKRAHVMRHHVQEKRNQHKDSHSPSNGDRRVNKPPRYLPWKQRTQEQDDCNDGTTIVSTHMANESISGGNPSLQTELPTLKPTSHLINRPRFASLLTFLDSSRTDPFDSLPAVLSKDDFELTDYWTNRLTYWSGQNKLIKFRLFQTTMNHPLSFQAVVLAYCARWKAQIHGMKDSREVQRHAGQATRSIEAIMNGSMKVDGEDLAMIFTALSLQEDRFGSKEKSRVYADQAVQTLRFQAGSNNIAHVFLQFVRYLSAPRQSTIDEDGKRWLITFLRGAERLMLEHNTAAYLSSVPQRRDAFQMESPLFSLLSSGPRPSHVPQDWRLYVVRNVNSQGICRTAALIYITAALRDFRDSPSRTSHFLTHLRTIVKEHQLDRNLACETLVWLLLEEGCGPDLKDRERGWSTGELLNTHRLLRPELQFHFNEILLSLLMLTPPIRGIDAFENDLFTTPTCKLTAIEIQSTDQ